MKAFNYIKTYIPTFVAEDNLHTTTSDILLLDNRFSPDDFDLPCIVYM